MCKRVMVLSAAVFAFGVVGLAQDNATGLVGADVIAARQASMDMSLLTIRSIENAIKGGSDAKSQGFQAAVLAKWAKVLPHLFPPGTSKADTSVETQALPSLSRDPGGFQRAAANYAAATARLADLASANDTAAFTTQLEAVNQTCNACHSVYKQPPPAAHKKEPQILQDLK